jgi:predicted transposase YdaD
VVCQRIVEGRQEEGLNFVLRQLNRRIGQITPEVDSQVRSLSLSKLESLGEALLDFSELSDLPEWLRSHNPPT